jgi:hypothetical protein
MQAAIQEMRNLSQTADATITNKILTKKQVKRLNEIDLQRRGPLAVLDPAIAEKLNIDDETQMAMREVQNQGWQAQRDAFRAARANGPNFQSPDGRFDRAAFQAYQDTPEGKAAQEKQDAQRKTMSDQIVAQIGKLMSKKQRAAFNAMLGAPFDLAKLTLTPADPNAPAAKAASTTATATATTAAKPATTAVKPAAATPKTTTAAPKTTAKKKATTKRTTALD